VASRSNTGELAGKLTDVCKGGSSIDVSLTVSPILDGHGRLTHLRGHRAYISLAPPSQSQILQAQKMQSHGPTLSVGIRPLMHQSTDRHHGFAGLPQDDGLTPSAQG